MKGTSAGPQCDRAVRVEVPAAQAELVGAILMEHLGPFVEESVPAAAAATEAMTVAPTNATPTNATPTNARPTNARPTAEVAAGVGGGFVGEEAARVALTFYPEAAGRRPAASADVQAWLVAAGAAPPPAAPAATPDGRQPVGEVGAASSLLPPDSISVTMLEVPRDWEEGWKDHFQPVVVGRVRVRPPWEEPATDDLLDVVITPGLGFGTGSHPTTRGTLALLQAEAVSGRAIDAGTGSGILAIAAAKLGGYPVLAFDNDPLALTAAAQNVVANAVAQYVTVCAGDVATADPGWFMDSTVLANLTLEPVLTLLERLPMAHIERVIVSGILANKQEHLLLQRAHELGLAPRRSVYEAEWVALELLPTARKP